MRVRPIYHRVFRAFASVLFANTSFVAALLFQLIACVCNCNFLLCSLYAPAHADVCQLFATLLFQSRDRLSLISVACAVATFSSVTL